jgi:glycolate oxidase
MRDNPDANLALPTELDGLRSILGEDQVLTDPQDTAGYRYDETEYMVPGLPLAVVFPRSTSDVSAILRFANDRRIGVVPRGAGTGLSGGAIAVDSAITLVTTRMDTIEEIDVDNLVAVVQPGVVNANLSRAVAERGLYYAPDPASYETSTIGGNIAENSGGLACVKYGVTGDAVRALEVVLADGAVIQTGGKNVKDVAGYNLTGLFVGSEGTLGVITRATLALRPRPSARLTLLAFFPTVVSAGHAAVDMMRDGIAPVTLELMDQFTVRAVDDEAHLALDRDAAAMLLVETDSPRPQADEELERCERACVRAGSTSVIRASDPEEANWLREARRQAHWALERRGVARMDDIGVPRSEIPTALEIIAQVSEREGLAVGVFGHAGDGNLHPTFIVDRDDPDSEQRINAARAAIYAEIVALGGTITGEHGTGVAKRAYLEMQVGKDAMRAMRAIKQALDPKGILNPGKVL